MNAPVFVKIDRYAEIESTVLQIKQKLQNAKVILGKLNQLKAEEEQELRTWADDIKQMEDKLNVVDHSLMR